MRYSKEESIKWLNAMNNACSLVAASMSTMQLSESEVKERISELANWIYEQDPRTMSDEREELEKLFPYSELEEKIKKVENKEELDSLLEEVKKVDKDSQKRVFGIYNDKKINLN